MRLNDDPKREEMRVDFNDNDALGAAIGKCMSVLLSPALLRRIVQQSLLANDMDGQKAAAHVEKRTKTVLAEFCHEDACWDDKDMSGLFTSIVAWDLLRHIVKTEVHDHGQN